MSIRDTAEWQAIRKHINQPDTDWPSHVTDAIYNALARHEAKHHGIEDATNPVADPESVARMDAPPPIPEGYCLVRREDVQEAATLLRDRACYNSINKIAERMNAAAARLEAAAKGDDGWRERCEINQTTKGYYVFTKIEDQYHYLATACHWTDGNCIDISNYNSYYFPTERAARDALAKAPKPEMKEARDGTV